IWTCRLCSFYHGSNDGKKGLGLIMLILIGTMPNAYALNRALPESQLQTFAQVSQAASGVINLKAAGYNVLGNPRPAVTAYVASRTIRRNFPVASSAGEGHFRADQQIRFDRQDAERSCRQHPQRH